MSAEERELNNNNKNNDHGRDGQTVIGRDEMMVERVRRGLDVDAMTAAD